MPKVVTPLYKLQSSSLSAFFALSLLSLSLLSPPPAPISPSGIHFEMTSSQPKPLPFYAQFTAGAIAGVTELLCLYPLDVVKTRMQLQGKAVAGAAATEHYNGMMDAFRKIIATEG